MFVLSGFADEISPELDEQLDVLQSLDIKYLELRGVWGKGVLALSDEETRTIRDALKARGMGVSAIGSPIGKIRIDDPFPPHLDDFRRALDLAEFFGTQYIRMFSFFVPEGQAEEYRSQVMDRLAALLEEAKGRPVTLLHENESRIYGDVPSRCRDILETMDSPQLRMTFDPSNFVMQNVHPFTDAYPLVKDYIVYMHIKDGDMATKRVVPAGEGDGQVREVLAALHERGFEGFASLEPHLAHAGEFAGFSGPDRFGKAAEALRAVLREIGA